MPQPPPLKEKIIGYPSAADRNAIAAPWPSERCRGLTKPPSCKPEYQTRSAPIRCEHLFAPWEQTVAVSERCVCFPLSGAVSSVPCA